MIRFTEKTEAAPAATETAAFHRFAVGASVMYRVPGEPDLGLYRVTKCMPEKAGEFQYRIKSDKGGRDRNVGEASLRPTDAPAA